MSIVVEDGTGLPTAQSYISVADAATYLASRGDTAWALASDALREAALVRATRALDSRRFRGCRISSEQALGWPRIDAEDDDGWLISGVPARLKEATAEAASLELASPGVLSPALERGGQVVEETVGPITTRYAAGAPSVTRYSVIDGLLAGLVGSGGLKVSR